MNALILAVILAQTAQPRIPQTYTPFYLPESGKEAYCVTLDGGGEAYHGYLIKDETSSGKPLQIDAYFLESGGGQLQPFPEGQRVSLRKDKIGTAVPESERAQGDVVERYLKQAGLIQVKSSSGVIWVQKNEADLAARANQMAQANTPPIENPLKQLMTDGQSVESGLENASVSGSGERPGFLSLWGPQIIIASAAFVLLAAVGYVTFLRG